MDLNWDWPEFPARVAKFIETGYIAVHSARVPHVEGGAVLWDESRLVTVDLDAWVEPLNFWEKLIIAGCVMAMVFVFATIIYWVFA